MTRIKKTRSLKRIHKVKTGSISKLKREAGADRQNTKRLKGRKTLSVFEKYLLENPEAKEALTQPAAGAERPAAKGADKKKDDKAKKQSNESSVAEKAEERTERSKTLLEQLDSKDFDNFY
ncbi:hypothetical protein HUF18_14325 [Thalassolituus sp. ST750PaO-4]|uniref:hypothetical protein n=1 Tax=Thalassolituus sp. ST750PaO-4 TaxID=2742965 RepID=UPI001CE286CA|nr:hypothetical protein [Thalassolituus sp. ST750PaO-4]MCA6060954.1 hypothetical protein [Thalassolituus sp. ST750PaO-4]